jgi:hypothetical protein
MEKKQTALDWFIENFERYIHWTDKAIEIFQEAKQMEKEQMIDAWVNGCDNGYDKAFDNITWEEMDSAKDNYYNETYQTK